MHEKAPLLTANTRDRIGSRYSQRDRAAGKLPAVIYGHKSEPVSITINAKEAIGHFATGEKVFRLNLAGAEQMVLLKDLAFDFLGTAVVHADFARVDLDELVRTRVRIELTGEAKGLKIAGAILIHPTSEIIIECRVRDLPESIVVNVADLDVDGMITAGEVELPSKEMKLITDTHAIVAQIVEQKEIVTEEAATVGTVGGAEPEVIGEKEKLEKEKAAGAKPGAKAAAGAAKPAAGAKAGAPAAKK